jgi:flagellar biogenesis protein FliO
MIGAFFAMFASDNEHIALMVNMTSVVSSAFTILFLFWSSSMILKKLISRIAPNQKRTKQLN